MIIGAWGVLDEIIGGTADGAGAVDPGKFHSSSPR